MAIAPNIETEPTHRILFKKKNKEKKRKGKGKKKEILTKFE